MRVGHKTPPVVVIANGAAETPKRKHDSSGPQSTGVSLALCSDYKVGGEIVHGNRKPEATSWPGFSGGSSGKGNTRT